VIATVFGANDAILNVVSGAVSQKLAGLSVTGAGEEAAFVD
jgi:hypothetical protein